MGARADEWWRSLTAATSEENRLSYLLLAAENLPNHQKAELVRHLLKTPDLVVTFAEDQATGTVIAQINSMQQAALADVLHAIADRIDAGAGTAK